MLTIARDSASCGGRGKGSGTGEGGGGGKGSNHYTVTVNAVAAGTGATRTMGTVQCYCGSLGLRDRTAGSQGAPPYSRR